MDMTLRPRLSASPAALLAAMMAVSAPVAAVAQTAPPQSDETGPASGSEVERTPPRKPLQALGGNNRPWFAPTTNPLLPPSFQNRGLTPASSAPPPFLVTPSISVRESWTDNVFLTAKSPKPDFISTVTPSVSLRNISRRFDLGLNYSGSYDQYADNTKLNGIRHNGITTLNSELIDQFFFLDMRASVSEQDSRPAGPTAALARSSAGGQTEVITYTVSPRFVHRLGDWALAGVNLSHSETINQTPSTSSSSASNTAAKALNNSESERASFQLRNGESFSQLLWDFSSNYSHTSQRNSDLDMSATQIGLEYRLNSSVGLLATTGHDTVRGLEANESKYNGLYFSGGIHYTPSPDTDMRIGAGRRYGQNNVFALVNYKIGPKTGMRVSHEVGMGTDAINAIDNLNSITRDETGNYVDPFSGRAADPSFQTFNRSNATFKQEVTSLALQRSSERDSISLTGSYTTREVVSSGTQISGDSISTLPLGSTTTSVSSNLTWTHRLSEASSTSASVNTSNVIQASQKSAMTRRLGAGLGYNYAFSPTLSTDANYRFSRTSTPSAAAAANDATSTSSSQVGNVFENTIFVSLRKQF